MNKKDNISDAIDLLRKLIETPSFSGEEDETASHIAAWFNSKNIAFNQVENNLWAKNKYFDDSKPTILLNSHHDTVKPNKGYTRDPFKFTLEKGKIYGLGSNDAGASVVTLLTVFHQFYDIDNLKYNFIIAITAEEENSGKNGVSLLLPLLPPIDMSIVGEPTSMKMAVSEKGLLVIDAVASGVSGHSAHGNTENAIYGAIKDIAWIKSYQFSKVSETLGSVKMSVTQINAGEQHNIVPGECNFVIDVRTNELYTNEEVFNCIQRHTESKMTARSFRLNSSSIPLSHPIVKTAKELGYKMMGSPTLSDQALMPFPSLKMGPGETERSHTANEYIQLREIEDGINKYNKLLNKLNEL